MSQQSISPADLRPRRRWYLVALGVFLVCAAVGVGLFVWQLGKIADGVNLQELRTGSNQVKLTAGKEKGIYATGKVDRTSLPRCLQTGPGRLNIGPVATSETFTTEGTTWYLVGKVTATKTGTYTVTCTSTGATRFAVGNRLGGLFVGGLGAAGMPFGLILLGALIAGTVAIVVLTKRVGHKRRLQSSVAGAPPGGVPAGAAPPQPYAGQLPYAGQPPDVGRPPDAGQPPYAGQPAPPLLPPYAGQPAPPPPPPPGAGAAPPPPPPPDARQPPEPPTQPGQRPPHSP